jgi:hypothetical protein
VVIYISWVTRKFVTHFFIRHSIGAYYLCIKALNIFEEPEQPIYYHSLVLSCGRQEA